MAPPMGDGGEGGEQHPALASTSVAAAGASFVDDAGTTTGQQRWRLR